MSRLEKKAEGLPQCYPEEVFNGIHEWNARRPSIRPPHTRDLLFADDSNYKSAVAVSEDADDNDNDDNDVNDTTFTADMEERSYSTKSPIQCKVNHAANARRSYSMSSSKSKPAATPKGRLPPGVVPQLISSSNTTGRSSTQPLGSTAVRSRSVSEHTLIAKATRVTGQVMAG